MNKIENTNVKTDNQLDPNLFKRLKDFESFTKEPYLTNDQSLEKILSKETIRSIGFKTAIKEFDNKLKIPSIKWQEDFSLILGLERLLFSDQIELKDKTVLSDHQRDVLSAGLVELILNYKTKHLEQNDNKESLRLWFEHATGSGKTVSALGFIEAARSSNVLILTHRTNLVNQIEDELKDKGYKDRIIDPILNKNNDVIGKVTVKTYQWFNRNYQDLSDSYTTIICDEVHTTLGPVTSKAIKSFENKVFIGMTATGNLMGKSVDELFTNKIAEFDLIQAAKKQVISPLRSIRIPPGSGVDSMSKVPLRKGSVDQDFDQEELAKLLDQAPFNIAVAHLYKEEFKDMPGVVYATGVNHSYNLAEAFKSLGLKACAVSGQTSKKELTQILTDYEEGEIDILINAQLLTEGWNSPRATVCMHLAPTASKRIYQQRVGRVTRRHPGKESGIVVDFVHPSTKNDNLVITLHSLLNKDIYRKGAIVIGPVKPGRYSALKVEKKIICISDDEKRRLQIIDKELLRLDVKDLRYSEQIYWTQKAAKTISPNQYQSVKNNLSFDKDLLSLFYLEITKTSNFKILRKKAFNEIMVLDDPKLKLETLKAHEDTNPIEKIFITQLFLDAFNRFEFSNNDDNKKLIWQLAENFKNRHEYYVVQEMPEIMKLLSSIVNSVNSAHIKNLNRLIKIANDTKDDRLKYSLLTIPLVHTDEAKEILDNARKENSEDLKVIASNLVLNMPSKKKASNNQENGQNHNNQNNKFKSNKSNDNKFKSPEEKIYNKNNQDEFSKYSNRKIIDKEYINSLIFHIITNEEYQKIQETKKYNPSSLLKEGFIHFSELDQVQLVANFMFNKTKEELIVLAVNRNKVANSLKYEKAGNYVFPHLYSELELKDIVGIIKLEPKEDEFKEPNLKNLKYNKSYIRSENQFKKSCKKSSEINNNKQANNKQANNKQSKNNSNKINNETNNSIKKDIKKIEKSNDYNQAINKEIIIHKTNNNSTKKNIKPVSIDDIIKVEEKVNQTKKK